MTIVPMSFANDLFEFCFARFNSYGVSSLIFIGKDTLGVYLKLAKKNTVASPAVTTVVQTEYIQDFRMSLNVPIGLVVKKRTEERSYFDVTVTDYHGNSYTLDTLYEMDVTGNSEYGSQKKELGFYVNYGTAFIKDIVYGYPKDAADIKVIIGGHSFVEGNNSTVAHKDKRFAGLIASEVGVENSLIIGNGGGTIFDTGESILNQVSCMQSSRYVLIMLGTNDTDNEATQTAFKNLNNSLISIGKEPIWLTIPPLKDGTLVCPNLNTYIKNNFEYIDVAPVFYNADGTINVDVYHDNVHPNILGHQRIFNVVRHSRGDMFNL
jgi:lysophospholipase L1-like esterase